MGQRQSVIQEELPNVNSKEFDAFFADLPIDPFLPASFRGQRQRRFSEYETQTTAGCPRTFTRLVCRAFCQSRELNNVSGGLVRNFKPIDPALEMIPSFNHLMNSYCGAVDRLESGSKIFRPRKVGVHQIRIATGPNNMGIVAPEGFHRDGFDYVGIFCVKRHLIDGGITQFRKYGGSSVAMDSVVAPGTLLTFDDRCVEHYTSPILSNDHGYRDVFILTASEC